MPTNNDKDSYEKILGPIINFGAKKIFLPKKFTGCSLESFNTTMLTESDLNLGPKEEHDAPTILTVQWESRQECSTF